jgi:type VI secretion system protein ImpH
MIPQETFNHFFKALQSDIRLEVILADLLTENLNMDDVIIESDSLFKRNYHYDIESAGETEQGTGKKKKLRFVVNREGIYDQLPEDLFHQVPDTKYVADKYEAIQEIKEQQELERNSRLFFQPIEQEFYNQRIKLELEERKFLFETNHVLPGDIFDYLWELPEFLDELQKSKLGLLMPVINKLIGKKEFLPFIFESITGDPVKIRETVPGKFNIVEMPVLGNMQLSLDSTLGGIVTGLQSAYTIIIFASDIGKLPDYMPGGKKIIIHEFLCGLFMPLDSEIVFEPEFPEKFASFLIGNDTSFPGRLNYTTII